MFVLLKRQKILTIVAKFRKLNLEKLNKIQFTIPNNRMRGSIFNIQTTCT